MSNLDYKRGEVAILKQQLRDPQVEKDPKAKRAVLEKVIGYMTTGIDMAPLFAEMILATARETIVLKKIGYLYIGRYAETQPELALLAVNTLRKDTMDSDPMIRGLALRTLSSLRVANLTEYLKDPISKCLVDASPYATASFLHCIIVTFK